MTWLKNLIIGMILIYYVKYPSLRFKIHNIIKIKMNNVLRTKTIYILNVFDVGT